jgi:hypothetical protein
MTNQLFVKRKFVWRIENVNREKVEKYYSFLSVNSEDFEIFVGENKTKW